MTTTPSSSAASVRENRESHTPKALVDSATDVADSARSQSISHQQGVAMPDALTLEGLNQTAPAAVGWVGFGGWKAKQSIYFASKRPTMSEAQMEALMEEYK